MNDANDPYENDEDFIGENMQEENVETMSNVEREKIAPENLVKTMISFNEGMINDQEEHNQINATILESFTDMQQKINIESNP